jgi:type IV pilus biogenesis protein CpaD/CtpE
MRPVRIISAIIFAAALAITGCTSHSTSDQPSIPAAAAPAAPGPDANSVRQTPTAPVPGSPHFTTPQASMRYLAAAYNRNDLASLMHVTTPAARHNLLLMRANAPNLQLVTCAANAGAGDYSCAFTHDFPVAAKRNGHGQAHFTVAPADRPGWYMTVLDDCD